ncbi:MAG: thiamine diphosphokinase [Lachnospiraceae bacterium]|nr:thiamine diphosphokinase [Lachnospiraceae bacterium]
MNIGIVNGGSCDIDFCFEYMKQMDCGYWIGVDSGLAAMKKLGVIPNLALGDFDSADEETLAYFRSIRFIEWEEFPPEKDLTDLELAVRRAVEKKPEHITVLGGTGTRFDHTLAAVKTMKIALDAGIGMEFIDPHQRIYLIAGEREMRREDLLGPYISFLPLCGPARGVTLEGFKYGLTGADLDPWPTLTVSNEPAADLMRVRVEEGVLLCVEARD